MLAWIAAHQFTLFGLIFMVVVGPAVGNYACSVVYRLPRGQTPFERHPYCGHCNADLKTIDLFPIWSWLSTHGNCRYCGGAIPSIYTVIEVVCGAVFIAYFLRFGISESFLLYTAYATFMVILAAIEWQQGWISATIYSYAFVFVMLARTLAEGTIYGVVQGSVVMGLLAIALFRIPKKNRSILAFEKPWIWWFVLLGALVPMQHWLFILPFLVAKLLVPQKAQLALYAAGLLVLPLLA